MEISKTKSILQAYSNIALANYSDTLKRCKKFKKL